MASKAVKDATHCTGESHQNQFTASAGELGSKVLKHPNDKLLDVILSCSWLHTQGVVLCSVEDCASQTSNELPEGLCLTSRILIGKIFDRRSMWKYPSPEPPINRFIDIHCYNGSSESAILSDSAMARMASTALNFRIRTLPGDNPCGQKIGTAEEPIVDTTFASLPNRRGWD